MLSDSRDTSAEVSEYTDQENTGGITAFFINFPELIYLSGYTGIELFANISNDGKGGNNGEASCCYCFGSC